MAIDVKKERRLNDMNALAESIKLGTELRRMDESIPTAEDMAEWDNKSTATNLVNGNAEGSLRGVNTVAEGEVYTIGYCASAEGATTKASGACSHAEGGITTASGNYSHSEGNFSTASGSYSHAEGNNTTASGNYSHTEGYNTTAKCSQHVLGRYNAISDTSNTVYDATKEAFIIGNGTGASARSNAFAVFYNGFIDVYNDIRIKTAGLLNTTSQTIIGAINELLENKQDKSLTDHTTITTPLEGRQAWNSTTHKPVYYNGTVWIYADGTEV